MKKILFVAAAAMVLVGCSSSSNAVNYRMPNETELTSFQIQKEPWALMSNGRYILLINGAPQDTITNINAFKPNDSKVSQWRGKNVEFSAKFFYYVLWSTVGFRVKVNNEIVLDEWN